MNSNSSKVIRLEHGNIRSSLEYFLKFNFPKNARILDIGCEFGSLISRLYTFGYSNVSGIDISLEALKKGQVLYPKIADQLKHYDGNNLPYEDKTFDIVMAFDVLEHIPNVDYYLKKQILRVLKDNGFFIFQTPNKIINIPWEILNSKSFSTWKKYHCSLQTLCSIRQKILNAGFVSLQLEKWNIITEHNINKVAKKIGWFSYPILFLLQHFPLRIFPNFWGNCRKKI